MNGALVCIDGTCVETDGSRGSRCDPALHSADCGPGLACRPEGVCGDLFADGAECSMPMALWGNECASRCCAGDLTSGLPGVCTTYGPE